MSDDESHQTDSDPQSESVPEPVTEPGSVAEPGQAAVAGGAADRGNRGRGVWTAVAVFCVLAGTVASVLGARAVAHNDSAAVSQDLAGTAAQTPAPAKHSCKGKNDCKGQGGGKNAGKNSCKGKGDCATDGSTPPKK